MNMLNKLIMSSVLILCISVVSGCAGTPIHVGSLDQQLNGNVDFTRGREISASAAGFQLFLVIPIMINSRHDRANHVLLQRAGNDYITDIKIQESWKWAYVGTLYRTTIKAMAYPRNPSSN
jgi:hypothetical protein